MEAQHISVPAAKVADPWAWWRAAVANPSEIGKSLSIHDGEPQQGYYRTRFKGQPWEPVAIWQEDGAWLAFRSGREVRAEDIWTFACKNPVSYEAYQAAEGGKGWADEPTEAKAIVGHNSGDMGPFEALRSEYLGEKELADEFMLKPVTAQADADKVAIWAKRLTAIKTKAEGLHKVEKQPHLDAGRLVDDKWRDLKSEPDELSKKLKAHILPFLNAQKRAEEERARKAAEEAAALRRQAEELARSTAANEAPTEEELAARREAVRRAQEAERAAQVQNASAGRTGARVSIRVEKRAKIVDFNACLMALKDRQEIIEVVTSLANRAVKSGFQLPGVEVEEFEKAV